MEGTRQNGGIFPGLHRFSPETLRVSAFHLSSAITRTKEWQVKAGLNVASSGGRSAGDGLSSLCGDSATSCGLTECVQERNTNNLSTMKRRRDGLSPLTTMMASSSPSFAASTASFVEDNVGNSVSSVGCRGRQRRNSPDYSPQSPEVSGSCTKMGERFIPHELLTSLVDKKAILEFFQRCKDDRRTSVACADGGDDDDVDKEGSNGDKKTSGLPPTNSSSLFENIGTTSTSELSERDVEALLSAVLRFEPSDVGGMDKDNGANFAIKLPGAIVETVSNAEPHFDMLEFWRCLGIRYERRMGELDDSKPACSEESEHEDLDDIQGTMDKMRPLSLQTMGELTNWWDIQLEGPESNEFYFMAIAEHFRLIAVTILAVFTDRLDARLLSLLPSGSGAGGRCQQCNNNTNGSARGEKRVLCDTPRNNSDAEVAQQAGRLDDQQDERVHGLLLSLRQDLRMLSTDHMRSLATMFGFVDCCHASEDVFMTISALGVLAFFSPLPLPVLEKVCRELSISTRDEATESADVHHLPVLLAEKVSHYFYPLRYPLPSVAKVQFMPHMQIHEHAPGRYTCTVDNANFMKLLTLHRLVSNRFSCNKISWYALLTVFRDNVSFYVWHRHSASLTAKMVIRTQDPKKKRRNNNSLGCNELAPSPEAATLRETSALFLERETEIAPGEFIGFENFVTLPIALSSFTVSQSGYRLYSCAEDRLVFQCALDLTNPDGTPFVKEEKRKSATTQQNGKSAPTKERTFSTTETVTGDQETSVATEPAVEDEKRHKELEKAVGRLEKNEVRDRSAVEQAWSQGHRQLMNDHSRSYQKALQKAKDRERKMLLAKVGPSPELQRELDTLTQTVTTNRAQVTKMIKAKIKEEEAIKRLREQIEEGNRELERLRHKFKTGGEQLASLEAEAAVCVARAKEREEAKRRTQRELAAALRIPELSATRHETLAINDFQSFLAPSFTNGTALQAAAPTTSSGRSLPRRSPRSLGVAEPALGLTASTSAGGMSAPLPHSNLVSNGRDFSPPLLNSTSGGGIMGVSASTWGPLVEPSLFSTSVRGGNIDGSFDMPCTADATAVFSSPPPTDMPHLSNIDAAGISPTGQGGGFTVTAPFSSSGAITRFALDANARPFTPTSMVTPQNAGNSALHTGFTVNAGVANFSRPSSVSTSPMACISGSSPVLQSAVFPERPRYTSVSTPVTGLAGSGPFGADPPPAAAPLFAPCGLSNGCGSLALESGKGPSLNFTTAPWN